MGKGNVRWCMVGGFMQYEYRFRIKMKWSYRRKVFHLRGIFAPNREVAEMKLKDYVENYLDGGKIMDRYDYDILYCEAMEL